jgi:hypothetical protein
MTAVDLGPLPQSAGVALVFWGAVLVTLAVLVALYLVVAVRRRRGR